MTNRTRKYQNCEVNRINNIGNIFMAFYAGDETFTRTDRVYDPLKISLKNTKDNIRRYGSPNFICTDDG